MAFGAGAPPLGGQDRATPETADPRLIPARRTPVRPRERRGRPRVGARRGSEEENHEHHPETFGRRACEPQPRCLLDLARRSPNLEARQHEVHDRALRARARAAPVTSAPGAGALRRDGFGSWSPPRPGRLTLMACAGICSGPRGRASPSSFSTLRSGGVQRWRFASDRHKRPAIAHDNAGIAHATPLGPYEH